MDDERSSRLFDLADLILAVGRQIHAAKDSGESWTPLESAVMRFVDRNPGSSAGAASEATRVVSSNFSRALRHLESKGLVRREADPDDARRVRLYPTASAGAHLQDLRRTWSLLLDGIIEDPDVVDDLNAALRRIESALAARGSGQPARPGPAS